jgi:hypothetical protein
MSFTPSERTQYLVELALILILLIIIIMVIARLFGPSITGMINQFIQTPTPTPTPAPESIHPILFI